jgi:hypothetical protein
MTDASNTGNRITELTGFINAYSSTSGFQVTNSGITPSSLICAGDANSQRVALGTIAQTLLEEKGYQSGGSPSAGNPNPLNPPGLSNRK